MAIELEKIKAWDGQSGTGADARGVIDRNFEKVKTELEAIDAHVNTKFDDVEEEIVQLAGELKSPYSSAASSTRERPFILTVKDAVILNPKPNKHYSITTFNVTQEGTRVTIICHESDDDKGLNSKTILSKSYNKGVDSGVDLITGSYTGTTMYLLFDVDSAFEYAIDGLSVVGNWANSYTLKSSILEGIGNGTIISLLNKNEKLDKNVLFRSDVTSRNIFDPSRVIKGYYINDLGVKIANPSHAIYELKGAVEGKSFVYSGFLSIDSSSFRKIHFYSGEIYIGSIALPMKQFKVDHLPFVAPTGCDKIIFNMTMYKDDNQIMIEEGNTLGEYVPNAIYRNLDSSPEVKAKIEKEMYRKSTKNLLDIRNHITNCRVLNAGNGAVFTSSVNDVVVRVNVVEGKTYTLSGNNPNMNIYGYSNLFGDSLAALNPVMFLGEGNITFTIPENSGITFILIGLLRDSRGHVYEDIYKLPVQLEEGEISTPYEPYLLPMCSSFTNPQAPVTTPLTVLHPSQTIEMDGSNTLQPTLADGSLVKEMSARGISWALKGEIGANLSNNLFFKFPDVKPGKYKIFTEMRVRNAEDKNQLPKLKINQLKTPSGAFDNPDSVEEYTKKGYPLNNNCHPSMAYDSVGIGGYKYWLISSAYPMLNISSTILEDEDIFVSNDGVNWKRILSLYESDKSYSAGNLRLPPNNFSTDARRNLLLPAPEKGLFLEISTPEFDREKFEIGTGCFKHDPCLIIDNGYVYIYNTFHLPINGDVPSKHKFLVLIRTSNGINWEIVRSDGSTLPLLTEEDTDKIFTKDSNGVYNYIYYGESGGTNPQVIKWGEGDYELFWGYNYSRKHQGTTPFNFDFTNSIPVQDLGSGHHPGLLKNGGDLYLLSNKGFYKSIDRGSTFTIYPNYPVWAGGQDGATYKKCMCLGEGGKVIVLDVYRQTVPSWMAPSENTWPGTHAHHQTLIQEFENIESLISAAEDGLDDGYLDMEIFQLFPIRDGMKATFIPYIGNTTTNIYSARMQTRNVHEIEIVEDSELLIYLTLNARGAATVKAGSVWLMPN